MQDLDAAHTRTRHQNLIKQHFLSDRSAKTRRECVCMCAREIKRVRPVCVLCGWRLWWQSKVGGVCHRCPLAAPVVVISTMFRHVSISRPRQKPLFPSPASVGHMRDHVCHDYCHALGHEGLCRPGHAARSLINPWPAECSKTSKLQRLPSSSCHVWKEAGHCVPVCNMRCEELFNYVLVASPCCGETHDETPGFSLVLVCLLFQHGMGSSDVSQSSSRSYKKEQSTSKLDSLLNNVSKQCASVLFVCLFFWCVKRYSCIRGI